jgi:asparagine synthase (glutamine-hydrolysing)
VLVFFDLQSLDEDSTKKDFIRLPEMGGGFFGLYISQDFSKKHITAERDIFSNVPVYFRFEKNTSQLVISDNLLDFNLDFSAISVADIHSYICTGTLAFPYSTFYNNVYRIPAGARCIISELAFHCQYKESVFPKPAESLIQLLEKSIAKQIAEFKKIASHVSGGLDSSGLSSILKIFFEEKQTHFCAVDTGVDTLSEKEFQNDFEDKHKEKIHFYSSDTDAFKFLTEYSRAFAEPAYTITLPFLNVNLLQELQKQGYDALIMGNDGDSVLGHGYEYLDVLIQNRDVKSLKIAFQNISKANVLCVKYPKWYSFKENKKYNLTVMFFMARNRLSSGVTFMPFFALVLRLLHSPRGVFTKSLQTIRGIFNAKIKSKNPSQNAFQFQAGRVEAIIKITSEGKIPEDYQYFSSEINMASNHFFYNLSKLIGVKILSPFQDFDLLSYCQHVPLKDKFGDGFGRAFYRKELKGILPEKIRNRIHKTSFSTWQLNSIKSLLKESQSRGISPLLYKFVEPAFVNDTIAAFENAKEGSQKQKQLSIIVYRILNVNTWLSSF